MAIFGIEMVGYAQWPVRGGITVLLYLLSIPRGHGLSKATRASTREYQCGSVGG